MKQIHNPNVMSVAKTNIKQAVNKYAATMDIAGEEQISCKGDICTLSRKDSQFKKVLKAIEPEFARKFPILAC